MKLTEHPFFRSWVEHGLAPSLELLWQMKLLEVAAKYRDFVYITAEVMLHRSGLSEGLKQFSQDVSKHNFVGLLDALVRESIGIYTRTDSLEGLLRDHVKTCADPNCKARGLLDEADNVAESALGLDKSEE